MAQATIRPARRGRALNPQARPGNWLTILVYVILTAWAMLALFPIYWMFKNSFEPAMAFTVFPPNLLPFNPSLDNYKLLLSRTPMARWGFNTTLVSVTRTLGAIFFGALAGYAFAKLKFLGREVIFWALMSTLMIPSFITIIPQYQVVRALGWIDSYAALIVPGLTGGVWAMFLMRQFVKTLPTELIEAARIDGASEFGIFVRIILPLMKPGLAVLGIFTFMGNWNNFLWPLLVTSSINMRVLSVGMALIRGGIGEANILVMGQVMAGSTLVAIPMIVVFLVFQRYFLQGITIGAIKG
ncbi:MAG: carbohydrate ABC transporter permease [Chloroflexi bacterium]|nr:carbohydrate ABC transporter permease [Chloroflexota bacterium]